jgi:hypothetical protein
MAESNEQTPTAPNPSETIQFYESLQQVTDYYGAPDGVLQKLAYSANCGGSGQGTPITLFVPGGMVGGHIESGQAFLRAMAEKFRDGVINSTDTGELPEWADDYARITFEDMAREMDDQNNAETQAFEKDGTKAASMILTRYVHLKDAYYTVPGQYSVAQSHVRVKLSQVAGWTLGVTRSQPQQ